MGKAVAHRVAARHQGGSGRRADGHAMEGFESHALPGQRVDVRSFDVTAPIA